MEDCLYYPITLGIYALCVGLSFVINDLGVVFDIIGAFGFSVVSNVLPCIIYYLL